MLQGRVVTQKMCASAYNAELIAIAAPTARRGQLQLQQWSARASSEDAEHASMATVSRPRMTCCS